MLADVLRRGSAADSICCPECICGLRAGAACLLIAAVLRSVQDKYLEEMMKRQLTAVRFQSM
jgi:hypothetical protein